MMNPKMKIQIEKASCPKGHSLITEEKKLSGIPSIMVDARIHGHSAPIYLSAFFGDFNYETTLELNKGDVVELFCPQCETSLAIEEVCHLCGVPMFAIHLPDGGQVEACPTIGCHNHKLSLVDLDRQFLRFYSDETMPKM